MSQQTPLDRPPSASLFRTLFYTLITWTARASKTPYLRYFWYRLNTIRASSDAIVKFPIHQKTCVFFSSYNYPVTARIHNAFNNPLLEAVYATAKSKSRPIKVVDIGAAVGDTALLLDANCRSAIASMILIEGSTQFFPLLKCNTAGIKCARIISQQLSAKPGQEKELVRSDGGSASATGARQTQTKTLDQTLCGEERIDLIKIDADGFDGEILLGAVHTVSRDTPMILFEWHPLMCKRAGKPATAAFEFLMSQSYDRLIFFTKFGTFSHFARSSDTRSLGLMANFIINAGESADIHFDIIAIHNASPLSPEEIAQANSAKACLSRY